MNPSYDNSFGSFNPGGANPSNIPVEQPTVSGQGDIILSPQPTKKSKKWLIILGVLALIAICAMLIFIFNNSGGGVSKSAKESFKEFANYVLYGEPNKEPINSNEDLTANYYFVEQQRDVNNRQDLYDKTEALWNRFLNNFNSQSKDIEPSIDNLEFQIVRETDLLNFMKTVYTKEKLDFELVKKTYIDSGRSESMDYIDKYYNLSELSNNTYSENFSTELSNWKDSAIKILDIFDQKGCINQEDILVCALKNTSKEDVESFTETIKEFESINSYLEDHYNLFNEFISRIFIINALINNIDLSEYTVIINQDDMIEGDEQEQNEINEESNEK